MISYGKQFIDKDDINLVSKVLTQDLITQGKYVKIFEKKIEKKFSKHACVVANGTAALHLSLRALNIKKNDLVLYSPLSFVAGANAALYCQAKVDFVDINFKDYNIDIDKLEKKIKKYFKKKTKVKVVIITDYAGQPADWKKLKQLSKKYKFSLINDNCHALGASYKGNRDYAVKYADLVTLSFHPVKVITTGEGGAVLTNNKKLAIKVKNLRSHGIIRPSHSTWEYEIEDIGYNYRINDFQCALGISQLKKIEDFVKRRKYLASLYYKKLKNNKHIILPKIINETEHSFHLFPIQVKFSKKINKKKLFQIFLKNKIRLQVHYKPTHLFTLYKKKFNFKRGDFPNAELFYKREFSLPIFYSLSPKNINKVCNLLNKHLI